MSRRHVDMKRRAMNKLQWQDVLKFNHISPPRATVRRFYEMWRREKGLRLRCDNPSCQFHMAPLFWNGQKIKPILDHVDGNRYDHSPHNLRYLCPNCDSQLDTRGGANRGRVGEVVEGGYTLKDPKNPDGTRICATTGQASGRSAARAEGEAIRTPMTPKEPSDVANRALRATAKSGPRPGR